METTSANNGIGIEALPGNIKSSAILSAEHLYQLASVSEIPFIDAGFTDDRLKNIIQYYSINPDEMETELHLYAKELLNNGKLYEAWQVLLGVV